MGEVSSAKLKATVTIDEVKDDVGDAKEMGLLDKRRQIIFLTFISSSYRVLIWVKLNADRVLPVLIILSLILTSIFTHDVSS